jgi:2-keto-4-pentenoate hydratase
MRKMRKINLCAGIWVVLWLSLHAVPAPAFSHETLIGDIYRAYSERAPYPMPSKMIQNITVDQAYDIQDAFVRKMQDRGETIMGYKAGLTATPAIIATNVAARQVLIGKALPVNTQDLNAVSVKLFHNGQEIAHGMGKNALGDQWKALQWTVNHVVEKGGEIKNGDIVITGSLTPMMPVKPGKYLADFGDFGTIEFEYK